MKKKRILLTFATAIVFLMNFQISFADGEIITRQITGLVKDEKIPYGETRTLTLQQNKSVKLDLLKDKDIVLVLDNSEKETTPSDDPPPSPFKYALFAGSEKSGGSQDVFKMYGDDFDIKGPSHSNGNIQAYVGGKTKLDGTFYGVGKVDVFGNGITAKKEEGATIISMPDLTSKFDVDARLNKSYFSTSKDTTGKRWSDYIVIDGHMRNDFGVGLKCTYENGTRTWELGGGTLELKKDLPLVFDGNVKFSLDEIKGSGFIIATGDILFNNGKATSLGLVYKGDGTVDLANSAEIGFYSVEGNINFNMSNGVKFKGLIYAPGSVIKDAGGKVIDHKNGRIQMNALDFELYGSLVASVLEIGGNKLIHYVETALHKDLIDDGSTSEIHSVNVKEAAKKMIGELTTGKYKNRASTIDMATIVYSDTAHKLVDESGNAFFRINEEGVANKLTGLIDFDSGEGSNLGDGLRLAYHTLKEGNLEDRNDDGKKDSDDVALDDAEKYLVVFSYNEPSRYATVDSSYKEEIPSGDGRIKLDSAAALSYAENIADTIKTGGFDNIYFVDINSVDSLNAVKKVSNRAGAKNEFVYDPKAVMAGETVTKTFESSLNDSIDSILKDITYIPEVNKVEVAFDTTTKPHTLPEGVAFIPKLEEKIKKVVEKDGEMKEEIEIIEKKGNFILNDTTKELELEAGNYTVALSTDKTEAKIDDLTMFVKFNKITDSETTTTEPIKFEETELIYTFTLSDKTGVERTETISVPVDELKVRVEWTVDIN